MLPVALTIFLCAFLLFQVQPLIGKFILPWFGGSPAVWTTCLLFFQTVLLGGYAYAHLLTRWLPRRGQAVLHVMLLGVAVALLPIIPAPTWKPGPDDNPTWRILQMLTVCLGVPYLALAATSPLLQAWFGRVKPSASPYRLYALSNLGSLLALVSYPFAFEPAFARPTQANLWGRGLLGSAVLCAVCAVQVWRAHSAPAPNPGDDSAAPDTAPAQTLGTRALWVVWPACASVLLLATTNKICQDVAVVPFLWVLPLALYLASFIVCFDSPRWYRRSFWLRAWIFAMGTWCYALFAGANLSLRLQIGIYAIGLFVCCMVCHGELYRLKPHPRDLTSYYLMLAAGGALGGVFVAVLAPLFFRSFVELHAGMVACALLVVLVCLRTKAVVTFAGRPVAAWAGALAGTACLVVLLGIQISKADRDVVVQARNFYGIIRVSVTGLNSPADQAKILRVGDITHGLQFTHPLRASWPTGYYTEQSGVGLALRHLSPPTNRAIGVVGLGVGTLATYGQPGDSVRFYEINPAVKEVAEREFTYLRDARAEVDVIMGDARLSLEREAPQQFDLLALDAFSGDAVPAHLLTREAFETYLRHLRPDGVIAVNISNGHLNLLPVLQNVAAQFQLKLASIDYRPVGKPYWVFPCHWVLLTRHQAVLNADAIRQATRPPADNSRRVRLWTDDYASLFKILK